LKGNFIASQENALVVEIFFLKRWKTQTTLKGDSNYTFIYCEKLD